MSAVLGEKKKARDFDWVFPKKSHQQIVLDDKLYQIFGVKTPLL